jgi:ABC-type lipoprotein export system ATPase subunit
MIAAMDRPDAGSLEVFGRRLDELAPAAADEFRRRTVGFVFQLHNLMSHLTALENVQIPMIGAGLSRRAQADRAVELLERVGLSDRANNRPPMLSGGERQRVALARALANRPRLILADEPTGSLDSRAGRQTIDLLCRIQEEEGVTLLIVTHDTAVAESAGRILQMHDGRFVQPGPRDEEAPPLSLSPDAGRV